MPKSGAVKVKKKGFQKKRSGRIKKPANPEWKERISAAEIAAEDREMERRRSEAGKEISWERLNFRARQRAPRPSKKKR